MNGPCTCGVCQECDWAHTHFDELNQSKYSEWLDSASIDELRQELEVKDETITDVCRELEEERELSRLLRLERDEVVGAQALRAAEIRRLHKRLKTLQKAVRDRSVHEDDSAGGLVTGHCNWCDTHWYDSEKEWHRAWCYLYDIHDR